MRLLTVLSRTLSVGDGTARLVESFNLHSGKASVEPGVVRVRLARIREERPTRATLVQGLDRAATF